MTDLRTSTDVEQRSPDAPEARKKRDGGAVGAGNARKNVARGLGLFGIGLGIAELAAPRQLAYLTGLEGNERLLRLFGAREIASGIPLLLADEPAPWLWARVAGDALDGGLLGAGLAARDPARRKRALFATLAVAPVVALDLFYAIKGRQTGASQSSPALPISYVRYSDDVEVVTDDEPAVIEQILQSLHRLHDRNVEKFGRPVRVSHGKMHGAAVGELTVLDDLPAELRQGLFATPGRYPTIVRLANVPGELDSDIVATQRGLAFKVLGVEGEMLPGHGGERTQDFVLDTGNRFAAADAKAFLQNHLLLEHMPRVPDAVKGAVSAVSLRANQALHAAGGDSATLDFFGHPRLHPMAEAYFTQAPIRYGDHIAKLAVVPVAPAQRALDGTKTDPSQDPDALRTATVDYLRDNDAVFEVRVQLCTDLKRMPVEDASKEWPEDESPYRTVARLVLPRQDAVSPARRAYVDEALSFSPSHGLAAHRPLGSLMRARLAAYPHMARVRREATGTSPAEPRAIGEVPA